MSGNAVGECVGMFELPPFMSLAITLLEFCGERNVGPGTLRNVQFDGGEVRRGEARRGSC